MGRKKGLAAIFSKPTKLADGSPSPPWPWPSCANNPQTASFHRQDDDRPCTTAGRSLAAAGRLHPHKAPGDDMYKTVNSVYFDPAEDSARYSSFDADDDAIEELDDGVMSYSTTTASEEWSEAVIRSLGRRTSTDRFFFDSGPPPASNSILAASSRSPSPEQPSKAPAPVMMPEPHDHREGDSDEEPRVPSSPLMEESVAVALDSDDPYADFRASMEEMVTTHGIRDWPSLQEMLLWYLRINGKHNHALIVGAFVDLLIGLASSRSGSGAATTTTTAMTTTTATATSSSSSSCSVAGDGASCSTAVEEEQCGGDGAGSGSGTDASCSPAASLSDDQEDEHELI